MSSSDNATMPTPTDRADVERVIDQIQQAYTMVSMLCTGEREWLMSIPAQPDHDPDLVIGHALQAAKGLIVAQATEVDRLRSALGNVVWLASGDCCRDTFDNIGAIALAATQEGTDDHADTD